MFPCIPLGFSSGLGAFRVTPGTSRLEHLGESLNGALKPSSNNLHVIPHTEYLQAYPYTSTSINRHKNPKQLHEAVMNTIFAEKYRWNPEAVALLVLVALLTAIFLVVVFPVFHLALHFLY
ncbi:MAG: hypothetical protein QXQ73_06295 [Desulfurococcaceae archaeon]